MRRLLQRLRCLWFVATMPNSGLGEASETLPDMRDFWRQRDRYVAPPPRPEPQRVRGYLLPATRTPPFVLEFDDE